MCCVVFFFWILSIFEKQHFYHDFKSSSFLDFIDVTPFYENVIFRSLECLRKSFIGILLNSLHYTFVHFMCLTQNALYINICIFLYFMSGGLIVYYDVGYYSIDFIRVIIM